MQNELICIKWRRNSVHKTFKIEIQNGGPNNSNFLQNSFPSEIRSHPLFNLYKFQDSDKSTPESCTMHWNLIKDDQFETIKFLKLKYRRGDQIIQTFCKIGSSKKLGAPSLICRNFKIPKKLLLNDAECIEI